MELNFHFYNKNFIYRINYSEDGKKHGECSLFSSLEFPTQETVSTYENQVPNSLPLAINNVITANDKPLSLKESVMVCSCFLLYIFNSIMTITICINCI